MIEAYNLSNRARESRAFDVESLPLSMCSFQGSRTNGFLEQFGTDLLLISIKKIKNSKIPDLARLPFLT